MLPTKCVIPLISGWLADTYYYVEVAFASNNPIHKVIFYSGFLHDGKPASYNTFLNPTGTPNLDIRNAYYMKVLNIIDLTT